ncbi:hypothetical protein [Nostoc sp.]|uniref:hypothetical protein n=1 Tax=Nostoc sp. TaxID=1180 RepID=UPI002FF63A77
MRIHSQPRGWERGDTHAFRLYKRAIRGWGLGFALAFADDVKSQILNESSAKNIISCDRN